MRISIVWMAAGIFLLGATLTAQAPAEAKKAGNDAPAAPVLQGVDGSKDGKPAPDALALQDEPKQPREGRRGPPGREGGPGSAATQDRPPKAKDDAEKKILAVLEELGGGRRGMMNVPPEDGRLLRMLTEAVGAKQVVEIGTSNGYSGIWFSLALRTTGGKLTTFEIDAGRAALARENFKKAGVDGIVTLVEGDAHKEIEKFKDPIDVLFIDADKEGYPDYLKKLLPLVRPGGLICAHNMSMRGGGIQEYYDAVTGDPNLETLLLHMDRGGISVTLKKR